MNTPKTYAPLSWTAADIRTLAPKMTHEDASAWLISNERHIRDRLCELGWDVIGTLLSYDGVDTSDPDDDMSNPE